VATVQSEGDGAAGGDAIDVATFHAAKGLEWAVVHLAGIEDGYVPISYAKTAAARAEEARLLYVAMTRAQRELRVTWALQRTFAGKVVDRRRSPLLDPVVGPAGAPQAPVEPTAPLTPPDGWQAELAHQRALLGAATRSPVPGLAELHRWRDDTARAARVEPATVLPDHVLARIAREQPRDLDELGAIRGVGTILVRRFGPAMLDALHPSADTRST